MARRFKIAKTNILLALGVTFGCLFLLEIGTRIVAHLENEGVLDVALNEGVEIPEDQPAELGHIIRLSSHRRIVYELKPDLSVTFHGASLTTDTQGFRSYDGRPDISTGARRIVGIGDSFMFGYGVEGEQSYLAVLEGMLQERKPELRYRIVNTAVPGYNTVMEVETLKQRALDFDPDLVLIEFVENDLALPNFIRAPKPVWTLRRSFFADFVRQRLGHFRKKSLWRRLQIAGLQGVPQEEGNGQGTLTDPSLVPEAYRDMVGWDAYKQSMNELKTLSEQQGFTVLSIFQSPYDSPLKVRAMELSNDLGFQVLDIGKIHLAYVEEHGYPDYLSSPLALTPTDGHPSVQGHRLAAEALFEHLSEP